MPARKGPRDDQHGTRYCFVYYKCRCDSCVAANNAYELSRYYSDKGTKRNSIFKNKYGITLDEYDAMRELQDYRCAICQTSEDDLGKRLFVDHNHITGQVRGLLCHPCNLALGLLKTDEGPSNVESALVYLLSD